MNWNNYESVWKGQDLPAGTADLAALRETFESQRRKLAARLFARDLLEGSAGLLVSGVFAYCWWHVGREGWPLAFAIALILGVAGFFVRERFRVRARRLGPDATLLAKVEADLAELRRQRHLLLHLWSWYLLPCLGAIVIVVATLVRVLILQAPPGFFPALRSHPAALVWIAVYLLVVLPVCFWGAGFVNRLAVRRQIEPRLAELEKLHGDLVASN
jgi:hypothetical protein